MYVIKSNEENKQQVSRQIFTGVFKKSNFLCTAQKRINVIFVVLTKQKISENMSEMNIYKIKIKAGRKNRDKENAILSDIFVFQAVKICSYLKRSTLYYNYKLCVHNFTMYNLSSHECTCFWWVETQSDLSASSFVSCIMDQKTEYNLKNPLKILYFGVMVAVIKTEIAYY